MEFKFRAKLSNIEIQQARVEDLTSIFIMNCVHRFIEELPESFLKDRYGGNPSNNIEMMKQISMEKIYHEFHVIERTPEFLKRMADGASSALERKNYLEKAKELKDCDCKEIELSMKVPDFYCT